MARYTQSDLTGDLTPVNAELEKIKAAIVDTLSRKGDSPNAMEADLDMNSNRILNLVDATNDAEAVPYGQVKRLVQQILGSQFDPTLLSPEDKQDIIDETTREIIEGEEWAGLVGGIEALELEDLNLRTDIDSIVTDLNTEIARIDNIFGDLDAIDTAIINETTARTNADEAIVTSVNGIAAQYDNLNAQLLLEQETRASADDAIVQTIQTLQTFSANIFVQNTEPTIGVAPDNASEGDLWYDSDDGNHPYTLLDVSGTLTWTSIRDGQFAVLQSQIQNEQTSRINADGALAQDITDLTAVVASDKAFVLSAIQDEQTARSTADSALASDITNLTAVVNTNNTNALAAISDEETARVNADGALASDITTLAATVDTNDTNAFAAIQAESIARIDGDAVLASNITTLTSTVNGNTASIQTAESTIDGLKAEYSVKLDVNGYVTGYGQYNEGPGESGFIVLADKFSVALPGAVTRTPFVVDGSSIYLSGATIKDGDITATKLSADAIDGKTITGATFNAGTINVSSASSGQRMEMSNSRIRIYDSSNTLRVKIGDLS